MANPMTPVPVTALSILHPVSDEVDSLLHEADPMAGPRKDDPAVDNPVWPGILRLVAEAAVTLLDADVGSVLVAGWKKHDELVEAGRTTRETGESLPVELDGHTVTLRQHPRVEVKWGPDTLATVHFEVIVEVRVHAVDGIVRGGSLVALSSGRCDAGVTLETGGVTLGPRWSGELDLHMVVDLGGGIPLA
jgi:hypothetical protein